MLQWAIMNWNENENMEIIWLIQKKLDIREDMNKEQNRLREKIHGFLCKCKFLWNKLNSILNYITLNYLSLVISLASKIPLCHSFSPQGAMDSLLFFQHSRITITPQGLCIAIWPALNTVSQDTCTSCFLIALYQKHFFWTTHSKMHLLTFPSPFLGLHFFTWSISFLLVFIYYCYYF